MLARLLTQVERILKINESKLVSQSLSPIGLGRTSRNIDRNTMFINVSELYQAFSRVRDSKVNMPMTTLSHSVIIPHCTYSPWLDNEDFMEAYRLVKGNTLVDLYRCYELWNLVGQVGKLEGDILEVGVWRGGTGCLMAKSAQNKQGMYRKQVFLCDTFTGVVKAGTKDTLYRGGEHSDTSIDMVLELATQLALDNVQILEGIFPDENGSRIAERRFSFCHIDVDVYASGRDVMDWIWPRLSLGGCVVYDDYGFSTCEGITQLVNEYTPVQNGLMLHNLNGHAIFIKTAM